MGVTKLVPAPDAEKRKARTMAATEQCRQLAQLLAACAEGDRAAFRRFYDLSARYVFGVVLSIMRDHDLAKEVAQEAFVRMWKRAHQYHPESGNPLSWIGTIARNCAIDRLRSERTRGFVEFTDDVPELSDQTDPATQTLDSLVIRRLMADLRPEHRKALMLCYFQGYTYIELASVMNIPVGTAKSWVRRGLAALREAME
ncbi:RNA polymerase sigma factor [uncultured Roseobacter sp.]|uniref:RNA polymerase sigma factor n=1 Tax=uncultured Roseobacter sp. TaxID=114847 RepID=UPI00260C0EB7|nr:RNA polymerase sigma factor [uncultured Roseobacter sp.]